MTPQDFSSLIPLSTTPKKVATDSIADSTTVLSKIDSINASVKDSLERLRPEDLKGIVTGENTLIKDAMGSITDLVIGFIPKLIGAILVLWIGWRLIKLLRRTIDNIMIRQKLEQSLRGFLSSLIDVILKTLLIIMAMDVIGIKATSFIALLGAVGLAIGMALQGTLQNFAGGVIIMIMKPFKVGDEIKGGGQEGIVKDIKIVHTVITTFNNTTIIIPNTELATSTVINYTTQDKRRVEASVGIAYGEDVAKARKIILDLLDADPRVLKDPEPNVILVNLNESSVDLSIRAWANKEVYWDVWSDIREDIYNAFNKEGISIPFPQIQIHMDKEK